jgi:hypothetical protein
MWNGSLKNYRPYCLETLPEGPTVTVEVCKVAHVSTCGRILMYKCAPVTACCDTTKCRAKSPHCCCPTVCCNFPFTCPSIRNAVCTELPVSAVVSVAVQCNVNWPHYTDICGTIADCSTMSTGHISLISVELLPTAVQCELATLY